MFHDIGLMRSHSSYHDHFEVDAANGPRAFLKGHGLQRAELDLVWMAIALHTTSGILEHMPPSWP